MMKPRVEVVFVVCLFGCLPAIAQNNSLPSNDWNSSWGFSSPAEKSVRLLQADVIRKGEGDYYDSVGSQNVTVNQEVHNDYSRGQMTVQASDGAVVDVQNSSGEDIGQNTNVIGSINQSETTIDVDGANNVISAINESNSTGCQDGSISIDSADASGEATTCN